jgi:hypothetical protein
VTSERFYLSLYARGQARTIRIASAICLSTVVDKIDALRLRARLAGRVALGLSSESSRGRSQQQNVGPHVDSEMKVKQMSALSFAIVARNE